jgi:pSer/pThr/pTyr-binding forkhead associated (FHA) protein
LTGYLSLADGRTMTVRDGFVLGRIAECDLVIDDGKASRRHARILVEAGVVEIEDLGSSNGTLLNGKPVTRRVLRSGDEVQIGKTVITFREGVMPGSAPVAGSGAGGGAGSGVLDDDNDLFADGSAGSPAASERTPPAASPAPPPSTAPAPRPAPPAANVPPPAPPTPTPPPPRTAVVEFADEVIEVRKPAPAASPARSAGVSSAQPVQKQSRVLQYSKQAAASSVLGDDLSQVSGGTRTLLYAVVLAIAIGLGWLVMRLVG